MQCKNLCQANGQSCMSCCTQGIERLSKEELDRVLKQHSAVFKRYGSDLRQYVKNIPKHMLVCEYLGFLDKNCRKTGCLIHPSRLGKEIRYKASKNNPLRGICLPIKSCNKEVLIAELPKGIREKLLSELGRAKDYYDYSMKVKHLVPRVYVQQKLKDRKLSRFAKAYLNFSLSRIAREPEARQCFRLKARLDFLIWTIRRITNKT